MMNNKDITSKVLERANTIKLERAVKKAKLIRITSISFSCLLILIISFIMPTIAGRISTNALENYSYMGTLFSSSSVLGYIIIGIISFLLGIVVTLVCYKVRIKTIDKNVRYTERNSP